MTTVEFGWLKLETTVKMCSSYRQRFVISERKNYLKKVEWINRLGVHFSSKFHCSDLYFEYHVSCKTSSDLSFEHHVSCKTSSDLSFEHHVSCKTSSDLYFEHHVSCKTSFTC
jgi:hypothetical protein